MKRKGSQQRKPLRETKRTKDNASEPEQEQEQEAGKRRELSGNVYLQKVELLKAKYPSWSRFFTSEPRHKEWETIRDAIEQETTSLCQQYAWAIPDERALNILAAFSPLIEIGAGKGYWARLLQERGADIVSFDKFLPAKSEQWTEVRKGGPEVLCKPVAAGRNLFLCYPDEAESIASSCLENFTGEYIIHVGEMIGTGTTAGAPVAPFGRTSSADFQVMLAETFHCLLVAELKGRTPISKDCISVWKRTAFVAGQDTGAPVDAATTTKLEADAKKGKKREEKNKKSRTESADMEFVSAADLALLREAALDIQYSEDQDNRWAIIPEEEALPVDRAAACLAHLLA